LVRRIRAGERLAEEELVERFSPGLSLMLRRLARNSSLAEDLHQETFRIVLEKARAGEIHQPEKLAGFLRGTARNLLLAEKRRAVRLRLGGDAAGLAATGRGPVTGEAPQLRRILLNEEADLVRKLLAEMRFERDRQILVSFYLSDRTKQEICHDLGVAPERFKKILFRARKRLRELWERAEKRQRFAEAMA
jgi:RNA polymerase sigma-70 factor (ECF subfamily)